MESEKRADLFKNIESIHESIADKFFKSCREVNQKDQVYIFSFALDMHFGQIKPGEKFPAQPFIEVLQVIYNKTDSINKYFIAVLAAELIQFWTIKPPRGADKATVDAINKQYTDLISIGEQAKRIAREETTR